MPQPAPARLAARAITGSALVLVLALTGGLQPASAQSLDVKGGLALSSVVFDDSFAETTPFEPGVLGGGSITLQLPWRLSLRVEVLFVLEQTTVENGPEGRFRYLDVPALIGYQLPGVAGRGGRPVVVRGGVVYRRLLEATETIGGESYSITDGVHGDDLALSAGAELPLSAKWAIDARYLQGQNGVYRRAGGSYSGTWRSLQLALHYGLWR